MNYEDEEETESEFDEYFVPVDPMEDLICESCQ
jgi:hypothetical protein